MTRRTALLAFTTHHNGVEASRAITWGYHVLWEAMGERMRSLSPEARGKLSDVVCGAVIDAVHDGYRGEALLDAVTIKLSQRIKGNH